MDEGGLKLCFFFLFFPFFFKTNRFFCPFIILPNVLCLTFPNAACCCPGRLALLRMLPQLVLWSVSVPYQKLHRRRFTSKFMLKFFFFLLPFLIVPFILILMTFKVTKEQVLFCRWDRNLDVIWPQINLKFHKLHS